jgi:hypothetical protein
MSASRLEVVEVIEEHAAQLTPEGRDLAERMELLEEVSPDPGRPAPYNTQRAQAYEAWDLPPRDRSIIERLLMLWEGLEESDAAERQGEPGERYRNKAVIVAAEIKARSGGRPVAPGMTPEQAVARLRDPS